MGDRLTIHGVQPSHPGQLSLAIAPWLAAVGTSERWGINRHTRKLGFWLFGVLEGSGRQYWQVSTNRVVTSMCFDISLSPWSWFGLLLQRIYESIRPPSKTKTTLGVYCSVGCSCYATLHTGRPPGFSRHSRQVVKLTASRSYDNVDS